MSAPGVHFAAVGVAATAASVAAAAGAIDASHDESLRGRCRALRRRCHKLMRRFYRATTPPPVFPIEDYRWVDHGNGRVNVSVPVALSTTADDVRLDASVAPAESRVVLTVARQRLGRLRRLELSPLFGAIRKAKVKLRLDLMITPDQGTVVITLVKARGPLRKAEWPALVRLPAMAAVAGGTAIAHAGNG